jgi:hypothetical protein
VEENAPPPESPREEPSFNSAAVEREAEAHFTPGPTEEEEEEGEEGAACRESAVLPKDERDTNIQ